MSNSGPQMDRPLLLVCDTSSARSSLAIVEGEELLALLGLQAAEKRSSQLVADIDWLLNHVNRLPSALSALGVVVGPGGFTGLRVGIATVKGFAHALKLPVVGLTSLEVRARAAGVSECTCILINAYRGEVFAQLFAVGSGGETSALTEAVVAPVAAVLKEVESFQRERRLSGVIFGGDGAELHREAIAGYAQAAGIPFGSAKLLTPARDGWIVQAPVEFLAADAARYAYDRFMRGEAVPALAIAACYIRPAEAEVKLKLGLIGKKLDRGS